MRSLAGVSSSIELLVLYRIILFIFSFCRSWLFERGAQMLSSSRITLRALTIRASGTCGLTTR